MSGSQIEPIKLKKYDNISTTQEGLKTGDIIDEVDIYKPAFETGDLKAEIYDKDSVRLYKEGEDGQPIYMGWTTIDDIDTGETNGKSDVADSSNKASAGGTINQNETNSNPKGYSDDNFQNISDQQITDEYKEQMAKNDATSNNQPKGYSDDNFQNISDQQITDEYKEQIAKNDATSNNQPKGYSDDNFQNISDQQITDEYKEQMAKNDAQTNTNSSAHGKISSSTESIVASEGGKIPSSNVETSPSTSGTIAATESVIASEGGKIPSSNVETTSSTSGTIAATESSSTNGTTSAGNPTIIDQVIQQVKDTAADQAQAASERLQAAALNQVAIENGTLVVNNEGDKPRICLYNTDGVAAITELNTDQAVNEIKYSDGIVTIKFANDKIQTYKIDENGNLYAYGFNGGRQKFEDATDAQKDIINIINDPNVNKDTRPGYCQAYVNDVFQNAGIIDSRYDCATEASWGTGETLSSDLDNIPVGACLFSDRSNPTVPCGDHDAGHVAIYIGDGKVIHNIGGVEVVSVDDWISTWSVDGRKVTWGWINGKDLSNSNLTKVIPVDKSTNASVKNQETNSNASSSNASIKYDGENYHQVQQNGENCGETAFLMGVNILLGKNEYVDNNAEFYTEAFGGDSSVNLPGKGQAWLEEKGLDNKIVSSDVSVTNPEELKAQLEKGNIVVASSGNASEFLNNKGEVWWTTTEGHFICFYKYKDGIFYANDPGTQDGAGVAYNQDQIQAWYDGRSYHPSAVLSLKDNK